jgi:hypothetical protein
VISGQDNYSVTIAAEERLRKADQKLFRLCELPPLLLAAIAGAGLYSVNEVTANNTQRGAEYCGRLLLELAEIILKRIKQPPVIDLIV